jgi:hypothetical protein
MKRDVQIKSRLQWAWVFFLAPMVTEAQCELFKSEMESVKNYMEAVSHQIDSLQTLAESVAYAAQFATARTDSGKVELMMGKALNAADEAVSRAAEAQYYSEVCGIEAVKSHAIDAEQFTLDARDFAAEAYENAKRANSAKNLGNIHYYMRKSQSAGQEAQRSADSAAYAAAIADVSCTHGEEHTMASNR